MKLQRISLFAIFLALFIVACGGGAEEAAEEAAPSVINVSQNDIYYGSTPDNAENPPTWNVAAGEVVTVNLENQGTLQHNFAVVRQGTDIPDTFNAEENSDIILQETGLVDPGQTWNDAFQPFEPGEYTVICTVAGHYPSMQGKLVVN